MAIYRNIQTSFWIDSKVVDDFDSDDKLFYLYLMTNPYTNLAGCYQISISHVSLETGFSKDKVKKLLDKASNELDTIRYDPKTSEVLILKWSKYNWTNSDKFRKPLFAEIEHVRNDEFRNYLIDVFNGIDTVSIGYEYCSDTVSDGYEYGIDTVSIPPDLFCSDTDTVKKEKGGVGGKEKEPKHKYGEYNHVLLTDREYDRLVCDYGEDAVKDGIKNVDEYCQSHGKTYTDYNLTLRKWGIKSPKLEKTKEKPPDKNAGLDKRVPYPEDAADDSEEMRLYDEDMARHPRDDGWLINEDGYWIKRNGIV